MDHGTDSVVGLSISSRAEGDHVIAALSGELDILCAPALREQLLGLLRPGASRLVLDLSQVSYADASGLAVLVGTGRRAGLLGGFLRLAAPTPAVSSVMRISGLHRQLDVFRTVQAAITGPVGGPHGKAGSVAGMGVADSWLTELAEAEPASAQVPRPRLAADAGELRQAIAALLQHADAWRDADPGRRFTRALHALARAYAGTSHLALTQAAHALLSVLARQPLSHSPAVAATASRLRRLLDSDRQPALP